MAPPRLPANVGHHEDTLREIEDTWRLARRTTFLAFGGATARLSHLGQSAVRA
jgi:hypothetical protein